VIRHASSRRDSRSHATTRVIRRKTNRRHMTGDHHGQTAGMATLLARALDGLLGTHRVRGRGAVMASALFLRRTIRSPVFRRQESAKHQRDREMNPGPCPRPKRVAVARPGYPSGYIPVGGAQRIALGARVPARGTVLRCGVG
jgi:hypothetical protein